MARSRFTSSTNVRTPAGPAARDCRHFRRSGFSLVEVMVATVIFAATMIGVYACVVKAYQFSQITRYRDEARSVLLSFVDQFERLKTTEDGKRRPFFVNTSDGPRGTALNWPNLSNGPSGSGTRKDFLEITLHGDGEHTIPARVTRYVAPMRITDFEGDGVKDDGIILDPNLNRVTSAYSTSAGYLLMGVFTISYELPSGKHYSQRLAAVRAVP